MEYNEKGIITLAYGLPKYIEMAKTLARSLRIHSPHLLRAIATDCPRDKELIELFDIVMPLKAQYGTGVRQKLFLDIYSPYKKTLFIDCDSIAVRDIQFIFDKLEGKSFSAVGSKFLTIGQKDPFVNVDFVINHFGIGRFPKFNGGLYYFEQDEISRELFKSAREILSKSHKLGFYEFRGAGAADEPIFAIAMMLHNQCIFQDQGNNTMRTPIGIKGSLNIDAIMGISSFIKKKEIVSPAIVHFAGLWNEHPIYFREAFKLKAMDAGPANFDSIKSLSGNKFRYQMALVCFYVKKMYKLNSLKNKILGLVRVK